MQIETAKASNQTPIALWSVYGALRPGENIQLVTASWDPDGGNITAYKWYIDGVLVSSSRSFTFSKELAEGQNSRTFSIKLQVKDDENTWGTRISSLTISAANRTEYYLTDHLGSIRTTIDDQGNVLGYDDYYPFGLAIPGRSLNSGTPNDLNKFTGHERDQEGGLDLDYMLARNYDPEIGRFLSVDPLHYKRSWLSPYNYVQNNPIIRFDPTGQIDWKTTGKGVLTTVGGVGQVTAGVSIVGATFGFAAPIGVGLIMSGSITTGLGMGQLAQGLSEKGLEHAIPSGGAELAGTAAAQATGNADLIGIGAKVDNGINIMASVLGIGVASALGSEKITEVALSGVKAMWSGMKDVLSKGLKIGATSSREVVKRGALTAEATSNGVGGVGVVADIVTITTTNSEEKKKEENE